MAKNNKKNNNATFGDLHALLGFAPPPIDTKAIEAEAARLKSEAEAEAVAAEKARVRAAWRAADEADRLKAESEAAAAKSALVQAQLDFAKTFTLRGVNVFAKTSVNVSERYRDYDGKLQDDEWIEEKLVFSHAEIEITNSAKTELVQMDEMIGDSAAFSIEFDAKTEHCAAVHTRRGTIPASTSVSVTPRRTDGGKLDSISYSRLMGLYFQYAPK